MAEEKKVARGLDRAIKNNGVEWNKLSVPFPPQCKYTARLVLVGPEYKATMKATLDGSAPIYLLR